MKNKVKRIAIRYPKLFSFTAKLYQKVGLNFKDKGSNNHISNISSIFRKTKMKFVGINNQICLGKNSYIYNCDITVFGNDNHIIVGDNVILRNSRININNNGNTLKVGNRTSVGSRLSLILKEGTKIIIGEECMFAQDITLRSGDGHPIFDRKSGERINVSEDIKIGSHVWFGEKVIVNKGVEIPNNCIVGTGAIVTKKFQEEGTILAGVPAKIVRKNIHWEI